LFYEVSLILSGIVQTEISYVFLTSFLVFVFIIMITCYMCNNLLFR